MRESNDVGLLARLPLFAGVAGLPVRTGTVRWHRVAVPDSGDFSHQGFLLAPPGDGAAAHGFLWNHRGGTSRRGWMVSGL